LKGVDISQQLKEMVGPEAEFHGQQEPGLQAIMQRGQQGIGHYKKQGRVDNSIPIGHAVAE
jgi:hypothetical protein